MNQRQLVVKRGKSLALSTIVAVALAGGAYAWQAQRAPTTAKGKYIISMTDYAFTPSHMVWHVGERVTITLVNNSQSHPEKSHEFMVGRTPRTAKTIFGRKQEDGFETPFFNGMTLDILSGSGMKMLMAGNAKLVGVPTKQVMAPGPMGPMEEMHGFMPVFGSGARLTFSFVVPDRPGKWTYGCFQQSGQHFLNGMKGTVTILPKGAPST